MGQGTNDTGTRLGPGGVRAAVLGVASLVVVGVAVALVSAGVTSGEVAATILFLPVFATGLLVGRSAGFVAAVVATVGYVAIRHADMVDAGAANTAVLALTRAAAYAAAAHAGALAQGWLPDVPAAPRGLPVAASDSRTGSGRRTGAAAAHSRSGRTRGPAYDDAGGRQRRSSWAGDRTEPVLVGAGARMSGGSPPGDHWGREPDSGAWATVDPSDPWSDADATQAHPGDDDDWYTGDPRDDRRRPADWSASADEWAPAGPPAGEEWQGGPATDAWGQPLVGQPQSWDQDAPADAWSGQPGGQWSGQPGGQWPAEPGGQDWSGQPGHPGDEWPAEPGGQDWSGQPGGGWPGEPGPEAWAGQPGGQEWGDQTGGQEWSGQSGGDAWDGEPAGWQDAPAEGADAWSDPGSGGWPAQDDGVAWGNAPGPGAGAAPMPDAGYHTLPAVDPETGLWTAKFLRDRLSSERARSRRTGQPFSLVLVQVPDGPLAQLPYRRQVTLLRELGYQFVAGGVVDHLVHVPDQAQHWFAVILPDTDRSGAHVLERRLRLGIGGYLSSRGLPLRELQSASLTAPDDDPAMVEIWEALIGPDDDPGPPTYGY